MLDLLLRLGEDAKQLDHDLHDYLCHQSAQRDLGIDFESFEEASDAFKEFKECVIARADSFGRLVVTGYEETLLIDKMREKRTVKRESMPKKTRSAGWNGTWWRRKYI
jgi:hypothetical protein